MKKKTIKDSVVLGITAGIIGNIAKMSIAWAFHLMGYLRYTFIHIAAGAFVPADFLDNPISLFIGFLADFIMATITGILIVYVINFTDKDYPIVKSIIVTSFLYVILYGFLMAADLTRASLLTPLPNLLLFVPHFIFGIIIGLVIKKYNKRA